MKLISILKNIVEGVSQRNGKISVHPYNNPDDLLLTADYNAVRKGNTVNYTFEYNPKYENPEEIKDVADKLKALDSSIDQSKLEETIRTSLKSLFKQNFTPDVVYYLGSSKGLAEFIAKVIQKEYPDVEVLPLNKKTFPSWENMLVDNYKELIKTPELLKLVQSTAQKMWYTEKGKIKSSGYLTKVRDYFKPKYELEKIIARENMLFVDDNTQYGKDFAFIKQHLPNTKNIMFYATILLPLSGATTTKASTQIKKSFNFTNVDPKYFKTIKDASGNRVFMVSSEHPQIGALKKELKIDDVPQKLPMGQYYKFKPNTGINSIEDVIAQQSGNTSKYAVK
jgi:hypothetical protein